MTDGIKKNNPRSSGLLAKDTYQKTSNSVDLSLEAKELQRCHEMGIATSHITPVKFVSFDESSNTLTTQRIEGRELFQMLWNTTYWLGCLRGNRLPNTDRFFARIEELGLWLRIYHETTRQTSVNRSSINWLQEDFYKKLADAHQGKYLPTRLLDSVEAHYANDLIQASHHYHFEPNQGFTCQLHGDFIVYNIQTDADLNCHILDFGDTREGCNIEDVARFYSALWAIAQTNRLRKRLFEPLLARFLGAYGLPKEVVETPYFRANLAYNFITHLNGQHQMKGLLSWNSMRELNQITQVGISWVKKNLP